MVSSRMNISVDEFYGKAKRWKDEFGELRKIIGECQLNEEVKWGCPCYTFQTKNIVLVHGFKEYCAVLFFKGSLLQDANGVLIQQTENVQAGRQMRFTNVREIAAMDSILKAYIYEAIEVEKAGIEVTFKKSTAYKVPEELEHKFEEIPSLKTAFEALTPGRQRAYLLHFSEPKQSKTRVSRIEKYEQHILEGKGLQD